MLQEWNRSEVEYPRDRCIHELFEAQVERTPDAVAVTFQRQRVTYRELNHRANQLARYLQKLGVGPEVLVGLFLERSLDVAVGVLGILKAGGAYVPLDPTSPNARLKLVLEDARPTVLLSQERLAKRLFEDGRSSPEDGPSQSSVFDLQMRMTCLDADWEIVARESERNPVGPAKSDHLAYVIYTSGSTGRPKGVPINHCSVVHLFEATLPIFRFGASDVWSAVHSYAFDFSVWEIWGALLHGGRLVIVPAELTQSPSALYDLLCAERVTILNQTPSALRQLVQAKEKARNGGGDLCLRLIVCGGEAFPRELAIPLLAWDAAVWNFYGPTEATVWAAMSPVGAIQPERSSAPIGRPLANVQIHLLDAGLRSVPTGSPGEICIGGTGLARGYLRRRELTAERFIPDPFSNQPGARLYRTGDLARRLPDGNIEFLGRIDHQLKIRGFRVEPGEIEAALAQHSAVHEAVVLARDETENMEQDTPGANESRNFHSPGRRLVAYIVPKQHPVPSLRELRGFLNDRLPEYMVPTAFVFMETLPLTPNGKIDRQALPAPDRIRPDLEVPFTAPRTPVEKLIADIWTEVLKLSQVGIHDNFFELGGHSLRATQIVSRVRDALNVEVRLPSLFENPTVAGLAEIVEKSSSAEKYLRFCSRQPISRDRPIPLSFSQERVWFIQQLDPSSLAYNFQATLRFTGRLDVAALERSLNEIVRRHEIFRTTFPAVDGRPVQVVHPVEAVDFAVLDLRFLPESEREGEAQRRIREELQKPFDVEQLPLIRWRLLRLGGNEFVLLHVEHHLVHDGWSFRVFLGELRDLYNAYSAGNPSPLPEPSLQFADFSCWQRQWLQGEIADAQLDYWKQTLAGCAALSLPTDRSRPAVQSYRGAAPRMEIPLSLSESLAALSRREGATLFMTMLTAFFALLHRYTGQTDICVGTGIANRRWRETERLIGMIVNNVVLRADLSGNPRFRELLRQVRAVVLGASLHQDLPFDRIVRSLQPDRNPSRNPLFQVMFNFHDAPMPELAFPGVNLDLVEVLGNGSAKFDLNIIVIPRVEHGFQRTQGDGITVIWEYNTDLFEPRTIERMLGHFQKCLEGVVTDPEQRLSVVPLLTEAERHQVLVEWNDTRRDYPEDKCVQELFQEQAKRTPDAVALVFEERQLTYGELNRRANRLAHYLRKQGVGPEVLVGVCLERSLEAIVAMLGILKAGGAYVPLDPVYPKERLAFMMTDAQARVLLIRERAAGKWEGDQFKVVCLGSDGEAIARESEANPTPSASSANLVYVMYTSGSTGMPKGVGVTHRSVARLVKEQIYAELTAREVFLQYAPLSFDASTFEIWGCLLNGGKLVVAPAHVLSPDELAKLIQTSGITTLWLTSALFHMMADRGIENLHGIKQLVAGGDVLSASHVRRVLQEMPGCRLINGYGPTENTTFSCCYPMASVDDVGDSVSIGRPIRNTQFYILDNQLNPVPIGIPGEICIGGVGLARGYVNRPELTAERIIPDPFGDEEGARLYRTGDRARYLADGNIEFLGRIDNQVKVRGFRIEVGEIESVLGGHPGVGEAVVAAREEGTSGGDSGVRGSRYDVQGGKAMDRRLAAYVVPRENPAPTVQELRRFLQEKLPEYMIPSAWVFLQSLPLTPSGKLDRRALPAPDSSRPELESAYAAPRTATEERLAKTWAEVLKLKEVGIHDNFFGLGGHSLLATQVISRVREAFGLELPLRSLFESPTVAGLAERIDALKWAGGNIRTASEIIGEREELKL